jgi:uncharacterized membrane protein
MRNRLFADQKACFAIFALLFASVLSVAMLVARTVVAGHLQLSFYVWNLFLAWMPLVFALPYYLHDSHTRPRWWFLLPCAVSWFLFFPNAPYIVTDLLHLQPRSPIPMWFDVVMMMSFAWTGLLLGYLSLFLMQEVVRRRKGLAWSWGFASGMLALSSFGIYLGRFLRWNSWDVIQSPFGLAADILTRLNFLQHPQMTAFCLTFFAFSLLSYATLYSLTHLRPAPLAPDSLPSR